MPEQAFNKAALASRLDSLIGLPAILAKAAECAKTAGRPEAVQSLADIVIDMLPKDGTNGDGSAPRKLAA